jgi:hypothetical protein
MPKSRWPTVSSERIHQGGGDDAEQEVHRGHRLAGGRVALDGLGIQSGHVHVEAGAGLEHLAHHQAQEERARGDHLEVEEGLEPHAPHALEVSHLGDARHHRGEHHRRHQQLDEPDEAVTERLERFASMGPEVSEQCSAHHRHQHLHVEILEPAEPHGARLYPARRTWKCLRGKPWACKSLRRKLYRSRSIPKIRELS